MNGAGEDRSPLPLNVLQCSPQNCNTPKYQLALNACHPPRQDTNVHLSDIWHPCTSSHLCNTSSSRNTSGNKKSDLGQVHNLCQPQLCSFSEQAVISEHSAALTHHDRERQEGHALIKLLPFTRFPSGIRNVPWMRTLLTPLSLQGF
jgi:hypothetical protein